MREESQLDDMRSAIRGDFERLAERRGEQELMRVADDEPDAPEAELPASAEGEAPRRSWFARFVSPSTFLADPPPLAATICRGISSAAVAAP